MQLHFFKDVESGYESWKEWIDNRNFRIAFVEMLVANGYQPDTAGTICFCWCWDHRN